MGALYFCPKIGKTELVNKLCLSLAMIVCTVSTCLSQRRADTLFLSPKEKLPVRIIEVEILDIKYKALAGDTIALQSISKKKIDKVVYGNGDTEEFRSSVAETHYPSPGENARPRYAFIASHPFQREISQLPEEQLIFQQKRFREKATTPTVLSVMTSIAGPTLMVVGISKLFDSDAAGYFVAGVCVATLTIPLAITGGKNRKRVNFIKTELERRKNGGY